MENSAADNGLGMCDVRGCQSPASVEWPLFSPPRRLCSKHHTPKHAPPGAFDPPDDFDIPDWWEHDDSEEGW